MIKFYVIIICEIPKYYFKIKITMVLKYINIVEYFIRTTAVANNISHWEQT